MMTARQLVADVLHAARTRKVYASEVVDEHLTRTPLANPLDRRFVTQLVFGIVRRRGSLDALLTPFVNTPQHAVEPRVWDLLQLGAFQLTFLNHVPQHAAVHETVELAAHIGSPKAKGFVNGVLRRIAELVTNDYCEHAWSNTIPFEMAPPPPPAPPPPRGTMRKVDRDLPPPPPPGPVLRYRKLNKEILPNPEKDLIGYLSAAHSWPRWMAERWLEQHDAAECERLGFWFNTPPEVWLRTNKMKTSRENYRLQLAAARVESEPGEHPQSLRLLDGASIRELPGYDSGEFCVQDVSAMAAASALNPSPGMRILDLCSAPGGKTTHLAELMGNRGTIVACDIDQKRLDTVTALCTRLGITCVETVLLGENADPPPGPFSAALVDVPCSNTGVLGRRPEVRWRIKPNEFEYLIRLQTKLLIQAVEVVKPGGAILYSTCSIEPDENSGVVNTVRKAMKNFTIEAAQSSLPGKAGDGGYWARLRKAT